MAVHDRLAEGSTNREVARDLSISPNTVKVHVRNIFTKLGVSSRTEATTVAIQRGLVSVLGLEPESPPGEPALPFESKLVSSAAGHWRVIAIGLLVLVALLAGALIGAWFLGGSGRATPESATATEEPFVEQPLGENSNWFTGREMSTGRTGMAVASVGLNLYQIGGEIEAGVVNLVDVYETDSHKWHPAAAKPTAVTDVTAAVLFGEIYVPGGRLADGRPTAVVEAYSPANKAWRPVAPLPQPISGGLTLSDGNQLYFMGGWNGESQVADALEYDPGSDIWQVLPSMTQERANATGGVLENSLYVVGGYDGQKELAVCEVYSAESAWSPCPLMLSSRAGAGAAVLSSHLLYVIGGVADAGAAPTLRPGRSPGRRDLAGELHLRPLCP
jgi:DNA-binding CsgD family transcriptional regulator